MHLLSLYQTLLRNLIQYNWEAYKKNCYKKIKDIELMNKYLLAKCKWLSTFCFTLTNNFSFLYLKLTYLHAQLTWNKLASNYHSAVKPIRNQHLINTLFDVWMFLGKDFLLNYKTRVGEMSQCKTFTFCFLTPNVSLRR